MKSPLPLTAAALLLALGLAGCVPAPVIDTEALAAEQAAEDSLSQAPSHEATGDTAAFGEIWVYDDGVGIAVSEPVAFTPGEYALGGSEAHNLAFQFTLVNDSTEPIEPFSYTILTSGGEPATPVFDSGNPIGDVGHVPYEPVAPGETITWVEGYNLVDPASLSLETSPGFEYDSAVFSNLG